MIRYMQDRESQMELSDDFLPIEVEMLEVYSNYIRDIKKLVIKAFKLQAEKKENNDQTHP